MNATARKLSEFLDQAITCESPLSADEIPRSVDLAVDEEIEWVSSTFINPHLVNIFVCTAPTEPIQVLLTRHSDGGVIVFLEGPWESVLDAKCDVGPAVEGWTDV